MKNKKSQVKWTKRAERVWDSEQSVGTQYEQECVSVIQSQSREDPERMDALVLLISAAARADSTADALFLVHERHPEH